MKARAVRATFGTNVTRVFNATDALHQERAKEKFLDIDGSMRVGPLLSRSVSMRLILYSIDLVSVGS